MPAVQVSRPTVCSPHSTLAANEAVTTVRARATERDRVPGLALAQDDMSDILWTARRRRVDDQS